MADSIVPDTDVAKKAPGGKHAHQPEKTEEEIKADYAKKQQRLLAFFTTLITLLLPTMTHEQYVLLLAQIALMRFSPDILQFKIDGKSIKAHFGNSYAHFLGDMIYDIQQKALDRFMKELPTLSLEDQISVIVQVLRYYTSLSPLSDELGCDCPSLDAKSFKYHTLYLFSMHGIVFKTVCDYAVAQEIVKI